MNRINDFLSKKRKKYFYRSKDIYPRSIYNNLYAVLVSNHYEFLEDSLIEYVEDVNNELFELIIESSDSDIIEFFEYYSENLDNLLRDISDIVDSHPIKMFYGGIEKLLSYFIENDRFEPFKFVIYTHQENIKIDNRYDVFEEIKEFFDNEYIDVYYLIDFISFLNSYFEDLDKEKYSKYVDYLSHFDVGFNDRVLIRLFPEKKEIYYKCDMYKVLTGRFKFIDTTNQEMKDNGVLCLQDEDGDAYRFEIGGIVYKASVNCIMSSTAIYRNCCSIINTEIADRFFEHFLYRYLNGFFILSNNNLIFNELPAELIDRYNVGYSMNPMDLINFVNAFLKYSFKNNIELAFKFKYNNKIIKFLDKDAVNVLNFIM